MNKRKPATASRHAHSPRIAVNAQRASQANVRSPKDSVSRSVGAGSTEPSPEPHNNLEQDALLAEQGEPLIKNPEVTVQNDPKQMMMEDFKMKPWRSTEAISYFSTPQFSCFAVL